MGTHPIFESDFDCLTEKYTFYKMGEVRKRKVSAEEKNGKGAPEPQIIQKGGGLGLIPVVLIAAILAGSGCHVIKKDTAADIAELTRFIDDLKVRNSETLELVTSLRAAVVQKDAMIENLGKSLKATEDQALADRASIKTVDDSLEKLKKAFREKKREFEVDITNLKSRDFVHTSGAENLTDELNKLSDKIDETDTKIKDEVSVKYEDNMQNIRNLGSKIEQASQAALRANKKMEATDVRMEELKQDLLTAEEASKSRTEQISDLEGKLESAKTEAEEKLNQINKVVNSLPTGVQEDLSKQGSEIVSVVSKLEALEAKVTEVLDSLTKVETEKSD